MNTEDRIQAARRFYNGNVRDYRNKCESFPSSAIAQMFGFQPAGFFEVEPAVREAPWSPDSRRRRAPCIDGGDTLRAFINF